MSLELALKENTDTMKQLIAVWNKLSTQGVAIAQGIDNGTIDAVTAAGAPLPVIDKAEAKKPAAESPQPETAAASPASKPAESKSEAAAEPIAYKTVADAITNGVKVNRDHVLATLAKFGAKKGPELKAEQYADFLAAL